MGVPSDALVESFKGSLGLFFGQRQLSKGRGSCELLASITKLREGDLSRALRICTLNSLLPLNLCTFYPFTWDICSTVQMPSSYSLRIACASSSEMPLSTLPPRCHCPYFAYRLAFSYYQYLARFIIACFVWQIWVFFYLYY